MELRLVGREIVALHEAAHGLEIAHEILGQRTAVEILPAVLAQAFERVRQSALNQVAGFALLRRNGDRTVREIDAFALGVRVQKTGGLRDLDRGEPVRRQAAPGRTDGRPQDILPRKTPKALMKPSVAGNRGGNAKAQRSIHIARIDDFRPSEDIG